jgi:hypothetical protein
MYTVRRVKTVTRDGRKLTAGITNLDTSLTDVDGDDFPHDFVRIRDVIEQGKMREEGEERVRLLVREPCCRRESR